MVNSGLMVCSFSLKKRFSRGEESTCFLNDHFERKDEEENVDTYSNVLEVFDAFFKNHIAFSDDEKKMKMFSVDSESIVKKSEETFEVVSFVISSGAYGVVSNITDRNTKKVKYQRTVDDADVKNFRCLIYIPKDIDYHKVTKGIMIFQTIGTYGVKTITQDYMRKFLAEFDLTLQTRSISVRSFIERLVKDGRLYKITFIKNRVSPDSTDNIFISTGREEVSYIKPYLKPNWFEKFLTLFDREDEIIEIDDIDYDDIKVQFKLGDNYRTVGLKNLDKLSIVEDIPETIFNNGRCDEMRLIEYMIETATDYKEKMIVAVDCGEKLCV